MRTTTAMRRLAQGALLSVLAALVPASHGQTLPAWEQTKYFRYDIHNVAVAPGPTAGSWTGMRNKRQHKRFVKECAVEFTAGGKVHRGVSEDFSLTGMSICAKEFVPADTVLDIVIHLPNRTEARVKGKVTRSFERPGARFLHSGGSPWKIGIGVELMEKDAEYLAFYKALFTEF